MDPPGRHARLDPLEPQRTVLAWMLSHDLSDSVDRVGEQDVLGHRAEVVVDQHPDRVRLAARMSRLEEHGAGVIENVLPHHGRPGDLRLAYVADPAQHLLARGGVAAGGQLGGPQSELTVIDAFDDAESRPGTAATEPSDCLDQRLAQDEAVVGRSGLLKRQRVPLVPEHAQ